LVRLYYKYQGAFLPILALLHGLNIQTYDWRYLSRALRDPRQRRLLHGIDVLGLTLHWVLWVIIPALFYPLLYVVLFHIAHRAMFGVAMFVMFAPAHYPAEAIALDKSELEKDPLLLQTAATVDFRTGFVGRLYCAGWNTRSSTTSFRACRTPTTPHRADGRGVLSPPRLPLSHVGLG
jgi:hypothetical protein